MITLYASYGDGVEPSYLMRSANAAKIARVANFLADQGFQVHTYSEEHNCMCGDVGCPCKLPVAVSPDSTLDHPTDETDELVFLAVAFTIPSRFGEQFTLLRNPADKEKFACVVVKGKAASFKLLFQSEWGDYWEIARELTLYYARREHESRGHTARSA